MTSLAFEIDLIQSVLDEVETMVAIDNEDPYFVIGYLQQTLRCAANTLTSLNDRDLLTAGPLHDHDLLRG